MRMLSTPEHEQLLSDSRQLAYIRENCPAIFEKVTPDTLVASFRYLLCRAALTDLRVTIEHKPLLPLAMGNYVPHIDVRPVRETAT